MCFQSNKDQFRQDTAFYNDRFASGYMEEWPADKQRRVSDIIKKLDLPEIGDVLDYGCGNGVFTNVLKKALPKWNINGVDISSVAIDNARKRYPECTFFLATNHSLENKKFDFIFSHHTLEHVDDIEGAWSRIVRLLNDQGSVLHILPCGNPGSFEYNLCMLKKGGINKNNGDRFFFEDDSHLRRLTTKELNRLASKYGFEPSLFYYSNQYFGAINWITSYSPKFILKTFSPLRAKSLIAALKLTWLSIVFFIIKLLRFPANAIEHRRKRMKRYQYFLLFMLLVIFYPISKWTNIYLEKKARREWELDREKANGSEIYAYFRKIQKATKGDPLVSIIMPTYNSGEFLPETIGSVLNQTYKNWELLIVDDGSTDNTLLISEEYAAKDNRIKVFPLGYNSGIPAIPRNHGIRNAKGDYIAFLDSDDIWLSDKLRKQVDFLENNRDIFLLYAKCIIEKDGKQLGITPKKPKSGYIFNDLFFNFNFIDCLSVIMRNRNENNTYFFDQDRELASVEDYALWLDISRKEKISFINEPLGIYKINPKGISASGFSNFKKCGLVLKKFSKYFSRSERLMTFSKFYLTLSSVAIETLLSNTKRAILGKTS